MSRLLPPRCRRIVKLLSVKVFAARYAPDLLRAVARGRNSVSSMGLTVIVPSPKPVLWPLRNPWILLFDPRNPRICGITINTISFCAHDNIIRYQTVVACVTKNDLSGPGVDSPRLLLVSVLLIMRALKPILTNISGPPLLKAILLATVLESPRLIENPAPSLS